MKTTLSVLLFCLACTIYSAAQPSVQWQKSFGGTKDDWANSVRQTTSDGGYIVAGYSNSNDGDVSGHHGGPLTYDFFVVKLYANGAVQWKKSFGGSGDDIARS